MRVGVNYPWFDYGWDFGLAPPSWRAPDRDPRWVGAIDDDLRRFQALGITVVRWFILADGLTYGSGNEAPWPDPVRPDIWHFDPPPLGADALTHFDALLLRFDAVNQGGPPLQLLPVLIDFHFCDAGVLPVALAGAAAPTGPTPDPGWVKQGRGATVVDAVRQRRFFDGVLDPLLRVSAAHRGAIAAWEVINEPEWVTTGWHPDGRSGHPVDAASMRAFVEEGKSRIRGAAFKPTIGFATVDTLRRTGITADINQFHHYPAGARVLEPHVFDSRAPGIVGEFATAPGDRWPELPAAGQTVLQRLRVAASRGYPLAIPWSFRGIDRHTAWTAEVERELAAFAREQAGMPDEVEPGAVAERIIPEAAAPRCAARTAAGLPCRRRPRPGSPFCWQ